MFAPTRLCIAGHYGSVAAIADELASRQSFSSIKVPTVGDCLHSGVGFHAWRPAMARFLAVHPGDVFFTGCVVSDLDWLCTQGAMLWSVTDRGTVEVHAGYGTPWEQTFTVPAARGVAAQVDACLQVTRQILASPSWQAGLQAAV